MTFNYPHFTKSGRAAVRPPLGCSEPDSAVNGKLRFHTLCLFFIFFSSFLLLACFLRVLLSSWQLMVLGCSWSALGHSGALLGSSCVLFGCSWAALGASCRGLDLEAKPWLWHQNSSAHDLMPRMRAHMHTLVRMHMHACELMHMARTQFMQLLVALGRPSLLLGRS